MANRILIVDDQQQVLNALERALIDEDLEIVTTTDPEEALQLVKENTFKVVISDERMPGMRGSELLETIKLRCPQTVNILLTGYATVEAAVRAVNSGEIFRFLLKPWDDFELKMAVLNGIEKHDQEMQNRELLAKIRTGHYVTKDQKKDDAPSASAEK